MVRNGTWIQDHQKGQVFREVRMGGIEPGNSVFSATAWGGVGLGAWCDCPIRCSAVRNGLWRCGRLCDAMTMID